MIACVQRCSRAAVRVETRLVGSIGTGLLVLVGIEKGDDGSRADALADRLRDDQELRADVTRRSAHSSRLVLEDTQPDAGKAPVGGATSIPPHFPPVASSRTKHLTMRRIWHDPARPDAA
jgi:hypothetical protein